MKTTAEMIAVMQAFERGEQIEVVSHGCFSDGEWQNHPAPVWNWGICDYRIKPREPRVIWVNEYTDGDYTEYAVHESEEDANGLMTESATRTAVKYIEVIE